MGRPRSLFARWGGRTYHWSKQLWRNYWANGRKLLQMNQLLWKTGGFDSNGPGFLSNVVHIFQILYVVILT